MLTVKIIRPNGTENIIEGKEVQVDVQNGSRTLTVFGNPRDTIVESVQEGDVYVMSETGSTVASYHLWITPAVDGVIRDVPLKN